MKNDKNKLSLDLMKMLMCFEVVLSHYWQNRDNQYLIIFEKLIVLAVPIFMMISFMLTQKKIVLGNELYLKKRLSRLLYPSIVYAFVYYTAYSLVGWLFKLKTTEGFSDLLWQLLTGHSPRLNPAMWYIVVLGILTFFFWLLFKIMSEKRAVNVICILMVVSLVVQYTNINYSLFSSMRYELAAPLGRIVEMLPYAIIGFLLSCFNVIEFCEKNKVKAIIFMIILLWLSRYIPLTKGFGYAGGESIIHATILLIVIQILPWRKISEKTSNVLSVMSRYTFGIFCLHNLIGRMLSELLIRSEISVGSFGMCIAIYMICYVISYILALIPCVWIRKLVV